MKILYVILIVSTLFIAYTVSILHCANNILEITFLNIGQGDAIYIHFPNTADVLVDTGPHNNINGALDNVISFFNSSFDIVFITHMDSDHHGGLTTLQKNFSIHHFITASVFESDDLILNESIKNMSTNTTVSHMSAGDRIVIDSNRNIFFEVLYPSETNKEKDTNDQSLVVRLVYNNISFLLTGDISKRIEEQILITYPDYISSDVLKLAHHGSRTSSGENFVKAVSPQYAIVSAGDNNSYGHPHREVLSTLEKLSIPYQETKNGDITFETDGNTLWQKGVAKEKAFGFAECFF